MKNIFIDLETYSDIDLQKCGVYKYAESSNFEILLFGYSVDGGAVYVVDLTGGESIPTEILIALTDESVTKWAFNSQFERVCLSAYLKKNYPQYFKSYNADDDAVGNYISPKGWKCSLVWAAYMGLPLSLKAVGEALKLTDRKMDEGKALIKYFSVPCNPTKANGGRTRNLPEHDIQKWNTFKEYNKRDVEVEMSIHEKLHNLPVPDFVWEEFWIDQVINDRGIKIDTDIVKNAIKIDKIAKARLTAAIKEITDLENPNSVMQMKQWLAENGLKVDSLGKNEVKELLKSAPAKLASVLKLRQQLAKSSVKKYQTMQNTMCADHRARGMFRFYGANRSGRWAGRLIQLQNLPQNHMPDLREARELVKTGNLTALEILYDDISDTLSQLIRTAFIPKDGYKFIVSDFSAIEARVIAYIAGEKWREDVFKLGGDIYCASAERMFHCKVEKHGENSHLRQKGKIAELALGYGGSVGALKSMGALEMGMDENELQPLVDSWRNANSNIVNLWWDVDRCVKQVIKERNAADTHGIGFKYESGMLFIILPSGRRLCYVRPRIGENQFGDESVTYEGISTSKKWDRIESYGPKFVENIVQAISRDILCYAMKSLSDYYIVGHVHDELIIECKKDVAVDSIWEQMSKTPPWMPGLVLSADGYETDFYCKD